MSHFREIEGEARVGVRVDWRRAMNAIQTMRQDPQRTDQVFELNVALDGGDSEKHFRGFLGESDGAELLYERPVLLDALADFERLRSLPRGSLGSAYVAMMEGNGYSADGLRREAAKVEEFAELHPGAARSWFAERGGCIHDLLHVVTGYGQDPRRRNRTARLHRRTPRTTFSHARRAFRVDRLALLRAAPLSISRPRLLLAGQTARARRHDPVRLCVGTGTGAAPQSSSSRAGSAACRQRPPARSPARLDGRALDLRRRAELTRELRSLRWSTNRGESDVPVNHFTARIHPHPTFVQG